MALGSPDYVYGPPSRIVTAVFAIAMAAFVLCPAYTRVEFARSQLAVQIPQGRPFRIETLHRGYSAFGCGRLASQGVVLKFLVGDSDVIEPGFGAWPDGPADQISQGNAALWRRCEHEYPRGSSVDDLAHAAVLLAWGRGEGSGPSAGTPARP